MEICIEYDDHDLSAGTPVDPSILATHGIEYRIIDTVPTNWGTPSLAKSKILWEPYITVVKEKYGFLSSDVVDVRPEDVVGYRTLTFAREHTHDDFEVRLFTHGTTWFYFHFGTKVYRLKCTEGTFLAIPAYARHWFDMGKKPDFSCIRFFSKEKRWSANYTGYNVTDAEKLE